MWGAMRDWLASGAVPVDADLASDLTAVEYGFNSNDQILLERKESMKSRGLASPDSADALAITFALPVPAFATHDDLSDRAVSKPFDYNPIELYERQRAGYDPTAAR